MKKLSIFFAMTILASGLICCAKMTTSGKSQSYEKDSTSESAIVAVKHGKVAGYIDGGTYIYKGIPYAKAERFMPPTEPDSWEGVRSSRAYGPTCPQGKRMGWGNDETAFAFDWDDGFPGEDCQRLNIWTPSVNDNSRRPVMVWLHGGGYSAGSGQELPSYDGKNLSQKDVVVVTLNHRLNVLGFLDLSAYGDKYAQSGNVGMLDIVAALKWVKENISKFGGDPDNVTIFGQSGGGGKVSTLLAMPEAKGLFHKAIVQSGSTLTSMTAENSRRIGVALMEELGLQSSQIDSLATIPYERLLEAGTKAVEKAKQEMIRNGGSANILFGWAPSLDGKVLPRHPFSPDAPEQSKDIPMIIGTTFTEFSPSAYVPSLRKMSRDSIVKFISNTYGDNTEEYISLYSRAYPDYKDADLMDTDYMFRGNAVKQGKVKANQGGAPVWMYIFGWQSPVLDGALRSTHCMEIPFVFNNAEVHSSMTGGGESALLLADRMSQAWVNFARYGNPNGKEGIPGVPEWEPYTPEEGNTMWWDDTCTIKKNHDKDLLEFVATRQTQSL